MKSWTGWVAPSRRKQHGQLRGGALFTASARSPKRGDEVDKHNPSPRAAYWKAWRLKSRPYVFLVCPDCQAEYGAQGNSKKCLECRMVECHTCRNRFDPRRRYGYRSSIYCKVSCRPPGIHGTPEHTAWESMIRRCYDPNHQSYRHYGARGIRVCCRWKDSFSEFLKDVGKRPTSAVGPRSKFSIDRYPDNNGNYEPGNVRWATQKEQRQNRSNNVLITVDGLTLCASAWAERLGAGAHIVLQRIRRYGWSPERAVTQPVIRRPI